MRNEAHNKLKLRKIDSTCTVLNLRKMAYVITPNKSITIQKVINDLVVNSTLQDTQLQGQTQNSKYFVFALR